MKDRPEDIFPDISDILARKAEGRREIARRSFGEKIAMMEALRERLEPATVQAAETVGWASDAIEAQAFGFLAARGLKGLPLSYPATTGVPIPMTGGVIARP